MKIIKGDTVMVTAGKDKGKSGKVEKVFLGRNKVTVAGVNLYKKHLKARKGLTQAGIVDVVKPLPAANVILVCPKCNLPTRVSYLLEGKDKKRVCKKCAQTF
ncbi:MAG: 50S ribosomal protein L24 [Candidatus Woykebacteria bacterium RIFCSPHIGHO2_12_FULL_45_10]|uniref:Large ribosomal subunit protein uL24 n=1 Tax=Candidatus Woykebacteria bacterium RIFCSPHIGHO2_12_FULL_45_10 TaxID=1802603 RepID=A0A1G1WMQ6_9BACT|nr:MAG: 50S ribosomal protein L24 [Candidatus Woykebacteria bacterium RIFCSPHIGHO2_12_FULL_45_10]